MRVTCLTTFLDGPRRFEKDDSVTVSDWDAARFAAHGWVTYDTAPEAAPQGDTDLKIHTAVMGVTATTPGV